MQEDRIIGPPGCGKTTYLSRQVLLAHRAGHEVLVTSLTKAAAVEVAGRNLPIDQHRIGTLHSHAYRVLQGSFTGIADTPKFISEWNLDHSVLELSGGDRDIDEDNASPFDGKAAGDPLYNAMNRFRARLTPEGAWPEGVRNFYRQWCEWKRDNDLIDFTDMLEMALESIPIAPGNPDIIFADEAQDFSALEMAVLRQWGVKAGRLIVVGDPYQCQPGETLVSTVEHGNISIAELDPRTDHLHSFNRHSGRFERQDKGYSFQRTAHEYNGDLLEIKVNGRSTKCTPNHKWLARWKDTDAKHCVVYLMTQGGRFRVGWCQLFTQQVGYGSFHLSQRARLENADAAWILKSFDSRAEASQYENIVAIKYGLPMITFSSGNKGYTTEIDIDAVFNALDPYYQHQRALECLADHGRVFSLPIWSKDEKYAKQGKRTPHIIHAANLIPELMDLPMPSSDCKSVEWHPFSLDYEWFNGMVYSLNIEPHHNYIADGILTMNSLYEWRGSDPAVFFEGEIPPENFRVLKQSYRVPQAVHHAAMTWIEDSPDYRPIEYYPAVACPHCGKQGVTPHRACPSCEADVNAGEIREGRVSAVNATIRTPNALVPLIEGALAKDKTVMVLTSCAYMLSGVLKVLRSEGIPFHNEYRRRNGAWNPLMRRKGSTSASDRLAAFLRLGEEGFWTRDDLLSWLSIMNCSKFMPHKQSFKKIEPAISQWASGEIPYAIAEAIVGESSCEASMGSNFDWYREHLQSARQKAAEFPCAIAQRGGSLALQEAPKVTVGTIHSVKGGEADVVIVAPDLSMQGMDAWLMNPASIYRLFYVAMTRAREQLYIMQPSSKMHVRLL